MRGKSTEASRLRLAQFLSEHLQSFGIGYEDSVICPTCLSALNLNRDRAYFSAGHILPEVSGGKEWTFLCRKCNSLFGQRQDKWFGEYLNILYNPNGTFLHAKTKSKYININGEIIRANIEICDPSGCIRIFVPTDENPPGKTQKIELGNRINFSVQIPLFSHENEVEIGYITAAYLYWFHEIGYNWVFQNSQDIVRKQIMECDSTLDGARVIDLNTDKAEIQGIGVLEESDILYPCCVVVDKVVIFPTPFTANAATPKNQKFTSPCDIHFLNLKILNTPYLTLYDGKYVVVPDQLRKCPPIPELLLYIHSDNKKPQWLRIEKKI